MKIRLQLFADEAGAAESNTQQIAERAVDGTDLHDEQRQASDETASTETTGNAVNTDGTGNTVNTQTSVAPETEDVSADNEEETEAETQKLRLLAESIAGARMNDRARLLLQNEEAELKKVYPSFNLDDEMSNTQFRELVNLGVPIKTAFEAANFERLMAGAMHYAAQITAKKTAVSAPRPEENPILGRASAVRKTDVNNLTKAEIMKIIEASGKGEKITFR